MSENELPTDVVPLAESLSLVSEPPEKLKVQYVGAGPITIELPDGRKVGMERPRLALSEKIASVMAGWQLQSGHGYEIERSRVRCLLYITDIDGRQEPKIENPIMRAALEEKLGDEFLDAIFALWNQHFASINPATLKVVKKS